jgi:hypothetical protein
MDVQEGRGTRDEYEQVVHLHERNIHLHEQVVHAILPRNGIRAVPGVFTVPENLLNTQ